MSLPNAENAIVELAKLRDYCLSPVHLVGKHKAKVFASALGLTASEAHVLKQLLLEAARKGDAQPGVQDQFGKRFTLDFAATHKGKTASIRSYWIILNNEKFPRLTTCYVL